MGLVDLDENETKSSIKDLSRHVDYEQTTLEPAIKIVSILIEKTCNYQ